MFTINETAATVQDGIGTLHTRALLVRLHLHTWTARKFDGKASRAYLATQHASHDAARINKNLLPVSSGVQVAAPGKARKHAPKTDKQKPARMVSSFQALLTLAGAIRAEYYDRTLAWEDNGFRLCPTDQFEALATWYRKRSEEFRIALDRFVPDYPALRLAAQSALGIALFNANDYPAVEEIKARFLIRLDYDQVPIAGDIRVDVPPEHLAAIEASVQSRIESAVETAKRDAWTRLHTVAAAMSERLAQPSATFRDSLIENVRRACDELAVLNVMRDPDLESMRITMLTDLASSDPQTIRDNKLARAQLAERATAIADQMSALFS